ncbi:alpha/beta hydrolase [Staphylococcus sp. SQ8-PEA]|uniref:Alpha/beta hydrolase n=1 Tax=Staphylococcus marylandisciuri TaxID=2981529 RepID=A0ABT2QN20_9STAP|nr:alpha/beta hydrolase [Staphylococcus marylandisciuri]MCU5745355.1 alpha/beta hydrolase [Staphylococcus marylandisciuri]
MLKKITTVTTAIAGIALTSYCYVRFKERRSYASFLLELKMRASGMKKPFTNISDAQVALDKVSPHTKGLFKGTDYKFKHKADKLEVKNSTVYVVNNQENRQQPVVLYIHGGAWFQDPLKSHFEYIDALAGTLNAKVVMPIYPKVPHADYRATFDLLETIYKQLLKSVEHSHKLIISGDSAGGQIGLSFAQYLKQLKLPQPSNIVLNSPVLDGTFSDPKAKVYEQIDPMIGIEGSKFFLELWAGDRNLTDWQISPINGDLTGLGHITLNVGTKETLFPEALKLSYKLQELGINHDFIPGYNMYHIYPIFSLPERYHFLRTLKQIINKH